MQRRVRGILFVDYVRMVRGKKDVDWSAHLEPEDLAIVLTTVDPDGWYPMETFERLGVGILREVAHGQLEGVRMWGRFQVNSVRARFPDLVVEGEPVETMRRFKVLGTSFFDYPAVTVAAAEEGRAIVDIAYEMGDVAEETASFQTLGFFESLVELAGGRNAAGRFVERRWAGAPRTQLEIGWD